MTTDDRRATVCLTFDFDSISVWIGPHAARSPSMISRGEFDVIGVERILCLLDREQIPATFFIPGHTVETFPDSVRAILRAGHEVGHHGYLHENPVTLEPAEERRVLERGLESFEKVVQVRPTGYRSPAWDNSEQTIDLLLEYGFAYESSLMGDDFTPYWCRSGDQLDLDGPYRFGTPVDLVELPVSWILDDHPHFEFYRSSRGRADGLSAPSKVKEIWLGEFAFMHRDVPDGVFTLTMHPQVIGHGHRMLMLEEVVTAIKAYEGVVFSTTDDAAARFREKNTIQ
ncbi:MAG: polysaccharide deacetylase [Thermomicrobiales bacterium]|nr:polysaccharide deacetylase [Thermomicrobiales bacterium]